jgi:hypothetical protein
MAFLPAPCNSRGNFRSDAPFGEACRTIATGANRARL